MSMWDTIKADGRANGLTGPTSTAMSLIGLAPFWLVASHRVAHCLSRRGVPVVPNLLRAIGTVVWGADIWPGASLGPGLRITHASGIVVGDAVVAGPDLTLFQGATLGGGSVLHPDWQSNQPRLGRRVMVSSHAVVAGGIEIGDDVMIGANAVVLADVAPRQIVRSPEPTVEPRRPRSSG